MDNPTIIASASAPAANAHIGGAPPPSTVALPGLEGVRGPVTVSAEMLLRLRYDVLMRQLEGMRAVQERSAARFFTWVTITIGVLITVYLLAVVDPRLHAVLPFLVVTIAMQAAFYLHGMDFARVSARAMEARINRLLDAQLLVAARLEEVYSYPLDEPKLGGVAMGRPERFFSAYALHWCCIWMFFFCNGALYGWSALAESQRITYAVLLFSWAGAHGYYLAWYFLRRHDITAVELKLSESEFSPIIASSPVGTGAPPAG
ncbi:hypothetical protein DB346_15145 [Verrucomicrobia bacterium LW23]|nr:hypothetical protein DB346_15145 [Verrucomicrobia bacterium LW23]